MMILWTNDPLIKRYEPPDRASSTADHLQTDAKRRTVIPATLREQAGIREGGDGRTGRVEKGYRPALRPGRLAEVLDRADETATGLRLNLAVVGGDQAWERLRLGIDVHPIR
jgi:bifunctional DNA-binding transcriptional regulator/antitoxin component of YhaV-PrlF toxin-antitoxin module